MAKCSRCRMEKSDDKYHGTIAGIGRFCLMELYYIDENGQEQEVPFGREEELRTKSYFKKIDEDAPICQKF